MTATLTAPAKFDRRAIAVAAWSLVKTAGQTLSEGMKAAWAAAKQTVKNVMEITKEKVSTFSFEAWGVDYTATVWNKAAGKEAIYIKRDGVDYALASVDGQEVSRIKTKRFGGLYSSLAQKADFMDNFRAALGSVEVQLGEPVSPAPRITFAADTAAVRCRSCGCLFTRDHARRNNGDWTPTGGECGC